jgi:two-component system, OmpR family, phosphate regulon sensor histidine kinase PhoR
MILLMFKKYRKLLTLVVVSYMLLAFLWWAYLLHQRNNEIYAYKKHVYNELNHIKNGDSLTNFFQANSLEKIEEKYRKQNAMIKGEASVFIITLFIGFWLIFQSYKSEINYANQTKNFLLSITHELKSPISSIQLVFDTFLKHNLEKPKQEQLNLTGKKEVERLKGLVENLLLSAKLDSFYQVNHEQMDIIQLIDNISINFEERYEDIAFEFHMPTTLMVNADKDGLELVLNNLIENAYKYSFNQKSIKIEVQTENSMVCVKIADYGIGIPEALKSKVLEKFYRIGNEETRQTKGTGLGLYIVNQIVIAHKGKLIITDNKPNGSIFNLKLPIIA